MQLRHRTGSTVVGRAAPRRPRSALPTRLFAALLFLLALAVALLAPLARADDGHQHEDAHEEVAPIRLEGQTLCLDASSVLITLEGFDASGEDLLRDALLRDLRKLVPTDLRSGGIALREASCLGSDSFVSANLWITRLDSEIYRNYRGGAYGLGVSLQVGHYADAQMIRRDHLLPDLRFEVFAEEVFDPSGNASVDRRVIQVTGDLLADLVDAWRAENR